MRFDQAYVEKLEARVKELEELLAGKTSTLTLRLLDRVKELEGENENYKALVEDKIQQARRLYPDLRARVKNLEARVSEKDASKEIKKRKRKHTCTQFEYDHGVDGKSHFPVMRTCKTCGKREIPDLDTGKWKRY